MGRKIFWRSDVVTSKTPVLETASALAQRVEQAAQVTGLDRLALSPQGGFASVAEGGDQLTAAGEFAELRLLADAARAVWGQAG